MHDEELVSYIEKELKKGFHHNEIKRALISVGHDAKVVEDSLAHVSEKTEKKNGLRKALSIAIPLILVAFIIIALAVFRPGNGTAATAPVVAQQNATSVQPQQGNTAQATANNREFLVKALETGNTSYCDAINDSEARSACRNSVQAQQEAAAPDPNKNLYNLALQEKNITICDSITDSGMRYACTSALSAPPPREISASDNENFDKALQTKDPSYCKAINDTKARSLCMISI